MKINIIIIKRLREKFNKDECLKAMETAMYKNKINLLFDLDGTISDSRYGIISSLLYSLEQMGEPLPHFDSLDWIIGPPLSDVFQHILKTNDTEKIAQAVEFYRQSYDEKGAMLESKPYKDIDVLLKTLYNNGKRIFLATSKPQIYAKRILSHFGFDTYFDAIHGSKLNGELSDKKELISFIINHEQLTLHDTVMIGDRKYDIEGAKANDLEVVAVKWGFADKGEFEVTKPNCVCSSPLELLKLFV